MTKASLMAKLHDFVTEIMKQMEERELTKEEAAVSYTHLIQTSEKVLCLMP